MGIVLGIVIDVVLLADIALFAWLVGTFGANKYDVLIGALGFDAVLFLGFLIAIRVNG